MLVRRIYSKKKDFMPFPDGSTLHILSVYVYLFKETNQQ